MEYRTKCTSYNKKFDKDEIDMNPYSFHIHTNRALTDGMYVSANENIGIQNSMVICCIISILILQSHTRDCIV